MRTLGKRLLVAAMVGTAVILVCALSTAHAQLRTFPGGGSCWGDYCSEQQRSDPTANCFGADCGDPTAAQPNVQPAYPQEAPSLMGGPPGCFTADCGGAAPPGPQPFNPFEPPPGQLGHDYGYPND